jgi:hypothetical protein
MRTMGFALLLAAWVFGPIAAAPDDPVTAWRQAAAENRSLGLELELAKGKAFYRLLDTETPRLRLMLNGVALEEFPVDRYDLGVPERMFVNGGSPDEVRDRIWKAGKLDPPNRDERTVIKPPDPGTPEDELKPPDPMTPLPVPDRFFVKFDGSLMLEVRTDGSSSSFLGRIVEAGQRHLADLAIAVSGDAAARVRVFLRHADAELLYQSLPPDTQLLVR